MANNGYKMPPACSSNKNKLEHAKHIQHVNSSQRQRRSSTRSASRSNELRISPMTRWLFPELRPLAKATMHLWPTYVPRMSRAGRSWQTRLVAGGAQCRLPAPPSLRFRAACPCMMLDYVQSFAALLCRADRLKLEKCSIAGCTCLHMLR